MGYTLRFTSTHEVLFQETEFWRQNWEHSQRQKVGLECSRIIRVWHRPRLPELQCVAPLSQDLMARGWWGAKAICPTLPTLLGNSQRTEFTVPPDNLLWVLLSPWPKMCFFQPKSLFLELKAIFFYLPFEGQGQQWFYHLKWWENAFSKLQRLIKIGSALIFLCRSCSRWDRN